jgi:hypothetical protein
MTQADLAFTFKAFDAEQFFMRRLHDHRCSIFAGTTDSSTRKERIRAAIIDGDLASTIIGKTKAGKAETYSQFFERHYGEPLTPKGKRHAKS